MNKEKYVCWKCGAETTNTVTIDNGKLVTVYSYCDTCIKNLKKEMR
jgi:hypothetical protein